MKRLISAIEDSEKVLQSEADWKMKYDVLFGRHRKVIRPLLALYGLDLEWCDPDTSYEEDVRAYMTALSELKERLQKLPDLPEPRSAFRVDLPVLEQELKRYGVEVSLEEDTDGEELVLNFYGERGLELSIYRDVEGRIVVEAD